MSLRYKVIDEYGNELWINEYVFIGDEHKDPDFKFKVEINNKLEGRNFWFHGNGDFFGKIVNMSHSDLEHTITIVTSQGEFPEYFYIQYNVIWDDDDYPVYFYQITQSMLSDGDLDHDGIADQDDDCDFQPGTLEFNGCPS